MRRSRGQDRPRTRGRSGAGRASLVAALLAAGAALLTGLAPQARAADTGWKTTGLIVLADGWTDFTTTTLNSSDDVRARSNRDYYGICANYGFAVPAGQAINGIEVQIEGRSSTNGDSFYELWLSWDGGVSWTTGHHMGMFTGLIDATDFAGGATDTWGRVWSPADFSDANFRFRIVQYMGADLQVDFIQIRVFYSVPSTISGKVFEDVNYGGGAGRNWITASGDGGAACPGAKVELFNGAGLYLTATTTDASGNYTFTGLASGGYIVRVPSLGVPSTRAGYASGLVPVLTFRTDATGGTAVDVTDYVGGQDPVTPDAGDAAAGWILNPATGVFSGSGSGKAHAFAPATLGGVDVSGVDFGWNFDTIVNTNSAGQGSLRQFIVNANALSNAGLAQAGQTAGDEVSIFMVTDGKAHPGLRPRPQDLLTAGVAVITLASVLPPVSGANAASTVIDGGTQTVNIGDTNPVQLGTGGTVGVDALALPLVAGPEVEITNVIGLAAGLDIDAADVAVRRLAIWGFGSAPDTPGQANIVVRGAATGTLIEWNVLGGSAASYAQQPYASASNIRCEGGDAGVARNNLIGYATSCGFFGAAGTTGWTIEGNEIRANRLVGYVLGNGIDLGAPGAGGCDIAGNLITGHAGPNITTVGGLGGNTIGNNTLTFGGLDEAYTAGVHLGGSGDLVELNLINDNEGAGILIVSGAGGHRISRNSIFDNGQMTNQIGIDLLAATDDQNLGTSPFVTLNDAGDGDTGGNALLNQPILVSAVLLGNDLMVSGFARPGDAIEIFEAKADASGFGEGETYLFTGVEGSGDDLDPGTGTYGPGPINGIVQGTDTTNRFCFTFAVPTSVHVMDRITATATDGVGNTSEFSGLVEVGLPAVVKRAYLADGTPLASGAAVPRGTLVKFLLYVSNSGGQMNDVGIEDVLEAGFEYVAGSIRTSSSVAACASVDCTPAEEAAIFAATESGAVGTDAVDADVVSYGAATVSAGNDTEPNAALQIPAHTVWAMQFTVRVR